MQEAKELLTAKAAVMETEVTHKVAQERYKTALSSMFAVVGGNLTEEQAINIATALCKGSILTKMVKASATLKDVVKQALKEMADSGEDMRSAKVTKLRAFVKSRLDGRSEEGRDQANEVRRLLGLPEASKPGPKPGFRDAVSRPVDPGNKPRTIEAVRTVLGEGGTMNAAEVVKALEEKNWVPGSGDPKTYIGFIMTQNKDKFERDPSKPRGYYRLIGSTGMPPVVHQGPPTVEMLEALLGEGSAMKTRDILTNLGASLPWASKVTKHKCSDLVRILKTIPGIQRMVLPEDVHKGAMAPAYWSILENPFEDDLFGLGHTETNPFEGTEEAVGSLQ
jgi:hypothetical protein